MYPSLVELYLTTWRINTRPTYLFGVVSHLEDDDCKITFGFPWATLSYNTYFDAFTHVFLEMLAHVSRVQSSFSHDLNTLFIGCIILLLIFLGCIPSCISIPYLLKKFFLESRNLRNHSSSTVFTRQTSKPCDKAILNVECKNDLSNNM